MYIDRSISVYIQTLLCFLNMMCRARFNMFSIKVVITFVMKSGGVFFRAWGCFNFAEASI